MSRIASLEAFFAVVQAGSFSDAAKKLGRSTAAVSRQVRALEERVGTRLLERTTRSVSVTEAGRSLHERSGAALAELDAAEDEISGLATRPKGTLRVNAPAVFGQRHLSALIPKFVRTHPEIRMVLTLTDRFVNVIEDGYDVVVRIGDLLESMLVAKRLAPCRRVLCAAPSYLASRGVPQTTADLDDHDCIGYSLSTTWRFRGGSRRSGGIKRIPLETDDGEIMRAAALAGVGIALLPTFLAGDDLRSGALVPLLAKSLEADTTIHVLYPERRLLAAKTRVFVDFLAGEITNPPPWDEGLDDLLGS